MQPSRKKAIAKRERYYFTGKPCIRGHKSKRMTLDGSCYQCRLESQNSARRELQEMLSNG